MYGVLYAACSDEAAARAGAHAQLAAAEAALWESRAEAIQLRSELWSAEQSRREQTREAAERAAAAAGGGEEELSAGPREVFIRVLEYDLQVRPAFAAKGATFGLGAPPPRKQSQGGSKIGS